MAIPNEIGQESDNVNLLEDSSHKHKELDMSVDVINGAVKEENVVQEDTFISWGCGEFGQHGHQDSKDRPFSKGQLSKFGTRGVKFMACGSSHTIVVTGE